MLVDLKMLNFIATPSEYDHGNLVSASDQASARFSFFNGPVSDLCAPNKETYRFVHVK